ncbi:TrbI/VirB10 family protein [Acidiferrobacter sp.]|uniref:TrbI/VirB10 family protein n=1 Tax=Acidiferrobacter sp. TaxID=1872107 RepID=UPI00263670B3|nr:TrbI/VirB10 family protein [Acidiferrobacter sp.]
MVAPLPVTPAAIVRRLAHQRPSPPSLFHRLLGLVTPRARPIRAFASIRVLQAPPRRPMAFAIAHGRARPVILASPEPTFGIRPGSWIPVILRHGVTDQDPALVVLHVPVPVRGLRGVLPAGTRLLGRVDGARLGRVQVGVTEAVTPRGRILPFAATAFGADHDLGLPAYVMGGRRKAALAAFAQSVVEGVDAVVGTMEAQSSVTSEALGQVGTNTLNAAADWRIPRRILYVPAQQAYVETQKTS